MTKLIFIEGVSGTGKTTTAKRLAERLIGNGYKTAVYLEFDYRNPIDFYSTAVLSKEEYQKICNEYTEYLSDIDNNTIDAGDMYLVRYYDSDTPLFEKPLMDRFWQREFCYNPPNPISLNKYTRVYESVWKNFALSLNGEYDYIIFDASLIRHPISDMTRNYSADGVQAAQHIKALLGALGDTERFVFYLKTDNIDQKLRKAHNDRNQTPPTDEDIRFWERVYKTDTFVIDRIDESVKVYNVSECEYDDVLNDIVKRI